MQDKSSLYSNQFTFDYYIECRTNQYRRPKPGKPRTSLESNTVTITLNPAGFVSKEMQEQRCRPNINP